MLVLNPDWKFRLADFRGGIGYYFQPVTEAVSWT